MDLSNRYCRTCDNALPSGTLGVLCLSCARAVGFDRLLPAGFFHDSDLRSALISYDFGAVFAAVREHTGLSQLQLAAVLDMTQSRISAVERGERRIGHIKVIARISEALGIPAQLLGFPQSPAGSLSGEEVDWMQRRDFLPVVTAAVLGSGLAVDLERLTTLPRTARIRRIGEADIDAIEAVTDGFRHWDLAYGGGMCGTAAMAQLHHVHALHDAECASQTRPRLLVATAELANVAGWHAYDREDHNTARRLWTYAITTARLGDDHPRSTDLMVNILLDMAHQSLHLARPREALQLTQLASTTATNQKHPVSHTTNGYISSVLGWCRAALGEIEPTTRAIAASQQSYNTADTTNTPPWAWFVTDAEIAAQQGYSHYLLCLTHPQFAETAITHLRTAVGEYATAHQRSRAINLAPLAGAYFQAGDTDTAVAIGTEAITAISNLSSTRSYKRLKDLDTIAERFSTQPAVADLRHNISAALSTAA